MSDNIIKKVSAGLNQIIFCQTLHSELNLNLKLVRDTANCLKDVLTTVNLASTKFLNEEEKKQIEEKNRQEIIKRDEEYKQSLKKIQEDT